VQIVAARLLQGIFGAALVPLSQATLLDINPKAKQGSAMAIWGMGVMVGPIIGPTLGGWLTENYDWRWVFFINLPIGLIAWLGIARYMPRQQKAGKSSFDLTGFMLLSVAVGLLQLFLDRGEQLDWFNSVEIRVEAFGALASALLFMAHTGTAGIPSFIDVRILKDRNYVTGVFVIFIVGLVMYATRALLPPMVQGLMGYSVITTGMVMAPSGAGTMFAMLIVGRLINRVDLRLIMLTGFSLTAFSLWQMGNYSLVLSESDLIWPGVIQGIGLGLVFVPLSTVTFSTLATDLRAAGTSLFSLSRNIGSSIGISIFQTLLSRTSIAAHAHLAEHVTIYSPLATDAYDLQNPVILSQLNGEVTRQAGMIGYVSDFRSMMYLTLAVMPMVLLIRVRSRSVVAADSEPVHVAVE
jgi:DHA2 family multidrug resistance protein